MLPPAPLCHAADRAAYAAQSPHIEASVYNLCECVYTVTKLSGAMLIGFVCDVLISTFSPLSYIAYCDRFSLRGRTSILSHNDNWYRNSCLIVANCSKTWIEQF